MPLDSCRWDFTYRQKVLVLFSSRHVVKMLFRYFVCACLMVFLVSCLKLLYLSQCLRLPDFLALLYSRCFFLHMRRIAVVIHGRFSRVLVILAGMCLSMVACSLSLNIFQALSTERVGSNSL